MSYIPQRINIFQKCCSPFHVDYCSGKISYLWHYTEGKKLKHEEKHKGRLQSGCFLLSTKKISVHSMHAHKVVSTCLCCMRCLQNMTGGYILPVPNNRMEYLETYLKCHNNVMGGLGCGLCLSGVVNCCVSHCMSHPLCLKGYLQSGQTIDIEGGW